MDRHKLFQLSLLNAGISMHDFARKHNVSCCLVSSVSRGRGQSSRILSEIDLFIENNLDVAQIKSSLKNLKNAA